MQFADDRAGTWVVLSDNENKKSYFVCNSHWTTVSSAERVSTAKIILDVVKNNSQGLPVIVLGDFNAEPGTTEIATIKNSSGLNLFCAHNEKGETLHGWDAIGEKKIDWILCSGKFSVKTSSVINTSYGGFWPSDHWPVKASLVPVAQ
jgi:endonuclease/exonuclease/phosphatase family metal-dependent hydrolase